MDRVEQIAAKEPCSCGYSTNCGYLAGKIGQGIDWAVEGSGDRLGGGGVKG